MAEADKWVKDTSAELAGAGIDKSDVAGALMRQEIRTWFRSLDAAKRTAMLGVPEQLDPEIAQAVMTAPAFLSDISEAQLGKLQARAFVAQNPEAAKRFEQVEEAKEAISDAVRAASVSMMKGAGITESELAEMLGEPTIRQNIETRLEQGGLA